MMWIMILGSVIAACIAGGAYMTFAVARFGVLQKLSVSKRMKLLISLGCIVVCFAAVVLFMDVINAIIVFLHVMLFFLLFGLIFRVIKAISGKKPRLYLQGWLALAVSVIYLVIGYILCNNVWQTDYSLKTDKQIGTLKVALIADSHLCTTFGADGFAKHLDTIMEQDPDILVISGDFVDDGTDRENMVKACEALGKLDVKYGVWFAYGNHDKGYYGSEHRGFSAQDLEENLKKNNVKILMDSYELIDDRFYIVGRKDKSDKDRAELADVIKDVDKDKYIIVLDHQPADYEKESETDADLVLSGHTHGGQFFPVTYVGEWIGANDRTYGYEERNDTEFIVTSGISDWAIKFKTGTKSEFVIINIEQE